MTLPTIVAVYFVIWWVCFVSMANIGVKTQADVGKVQKGTPAGAPDSYNFPKKIFWVSFVAAIVTGFIFWTIEYSGWSLSDYPFMPNFKDYN